MTLPASCIQNLLFVCWPFIVVYSSFSCVLVCFYTGSSYDYVPDSRYGPVADSSHSSNRSPWYPVPCQVAILSLQLQGLGNCQPSWVTGPRLRIQQQTFFLGEYCNNHLVPRVRSKARLVPPEVASVAAVRHVQEILTQAICDEIGHYGTYISTFDHFWIFFENFDNFKVNLGCCLDPQVMIFVVLCLIESRNASTFS